MSFASKLIERMERETGQRVDDGSDMNMALAGLFGALSREMGKSDHCEHDDAIAGLLIQHQMTPEYESEQQSRALISSMLAAGFSPEDLKRTWRSK